MKNKLIYLAAISLSFSLLSAAPSEINYQGVLTDQQGNPVNGVRAMQIKLYDAPTGGNMTYQENIGNVTVTDGIYSFKFGASGNGIASALNGNDQLALVVDSVEQPNRTKILAVPYALKAKESEDVQVLRETLRTTGLSKFGSYSPVSNAVIHQAPTDGYILNRVGGTTRGEKGYVYIGAEQNNLDIVFSSESGYYGERTTLSVPVPSGYFYWITGSSTAYWMPIEKTSLP
jgi:hypothetical protein